MAKLRVENLPEDTSVADLIDLFGGVLEVQKVVIHGGDGPPHAFVTLDSGTAANFLDVFSSFNWHGKRLKISHANRSKDYPF
jgi:hypothetical protein